MTETTEPIVIQQKQLWRDDYRDIIGFFDSKDVDYAALREMIEVRFADNAVLHKQCMAFIDSIEAIDAGEPPPMKMQAMVAKFVLNQIVNLGRIADAKAFLAACLTKWDRSKFLEADTMLMMPGEDIDRLDLLDKPWEDYQIFDRKAETTMILFCGHAHRFGVDLNAVALWLRSLPANFIFVRDYNLRLYLMGIQSLGNLDESVARLKQDLARLGTRRVVTMGNSGGVYGALHYGCLLDAAEILCFAGPTSLRAGVQEAGERPVYEKIDALIQEGLAKEPDLRAYLIEKKIPVRYFYAENYEFDAAQVSTIEGIANVSIEPVTDFDRHVVMGELARRHQLKDILLHAATG